jgi:hypothetical protein
MGLAHDINRQHSFGGFLGRGFQRPGFGRRGLFRGGGFFLGHYLISFFLKPSFSNILAGVF